MKSYIAQLVFQIQYAEQTTPQFDQQFRLIYAENMHQAFNKATEIGKQDFTPIQTDALYQVEWKFIAITGIDEVKNFEDGTALYSNILEVENTDLYIGLQQSRANIVEYQAQRATS